jgi:aspartyl-tRNA synthetase
MIFSKRTHKIESLTPEMAGRQVTLNGWVHRLRDYGAFLFINLRDRDGLIQCVVDDTAGDTLKSLAKSLKNEYCIAVTGTIRKRPDDMINHEMATGSFEIYAEHIEILNESLTPPFMIEDGETQAREESRLKYRYLDLRSGAMRDRIRLRHQVSFAVRQFLNERGFYEIETPILIKSTPEGARDYVVPSRIYPGSFFALPQSPQLYKQILMAGGMEKYFQIARCFRDEDPRGDRQPEFTQIDIEMSFVDREDVLKLGEELFSYIFKTVLNKELTLPFTRLSYHEAMNRFGSDKPDLRFGMELVDFSEIALRTEFETLKTALNEPNGTVKALMVKGLAENFSRKKASECEETAKQQGLKGLAWLKYGENGLEGGAAKFFTHLLAELETLGLEKGDVLLIGAGPWKKVCNALGALRQHMGKALGLADNTAFAFCWVVDFPLFEYNEETSGWEAAHHMFTMPQSRYIDTLEENPGAVIGDLYDLVLNGYELASGSIRVHDPKLQQRIFNIVGYPEALAVERFGFLLEAFKYGAPPHGGFAPGLDRLIMLMSGTENIRETIAFPKNTQGIATMEEAPAPLDSRQLAELNLTVPPQAGKTEF